MIENIKNNYIVCQKNKNLFQIKIENKMLLNTIEFLGQNGFITLSQITCTDWIEDDIFSINYNFTTKIKDINLFVQVDINRDKQSIVLETILPCLICPE